MLRASRQYPSISVPRAPRARAAVENSSPQQAARAEPPAATRMTSPGRTSSSAAISPV